MTKVLYNNSHLVSTSVDDTERSILKIEIEKNILSKHNKEDLVMSLTDIESSFLLIFEMNDDKFAELKKSQGLLVDLPDFVLRLIDLLESCRLEELNQRPKYFLSLRRNGGSWNLNFVEVIPLKQLTQLTLEFSHVDEIHFKKYLTDCLKTCQLENDILSRKLQSTELSLSKKLQDTKLALVAVTKELEEQKASFELQLNELRDQLQQQPKTDREEFIETQNKLSQDPLDRQISFAVKERTDKPIIPVVGTNSVFGAPTVSNVRKTFSQSSAPESFTFKCSAPILHVTPRNDTNLNSIMSKGIFDFKSVAAPIYQFGATNKTVVSSNSMAPISTMSDFKSAPDSAIQFGSSPGGVINNSSVYSFSSGSTGERKSDAGGQMMARRTLKVRRKR